MSVIVPLEALFPVCMMMCNDSPMSTGISHTHMVLLLHVGKAYFITNDEPIPFWDMPKYVFSLFSNKPLKKRSG